MTGQSSKIKILAALPRKGLHPMKGINTWTVLVSTAPASFALIPKVEGSTEEDDSSCHKSQKKHSVKRNETGT